jgi:hypothetical protein
MKNSNRIATFWLRRFLKYTSPLIGHFQNASIKSLASVGEIAQPVFILGVPRSGTTITYQIISNYYNVLYVDNLVFLCRENPFLGFWLSNRFFRDNPHNCFQSKQGNTMDCGLHAPNQDPVFWKKYIYKLALHSNKSDTLKHSDQQEIYNSVFSVINKYEKPLIMKGAAVANNLNAFLEIFPHARFIRFTRDPLYTAQSLLQSTRKKGIPFEDAWMKRIKPYNYKRILETSSVFRKIALYVHALYQQNAEDLKKVPKENYVSFSYEELCSSMNYVLQKTGKLLGEHAILRQNSELPDLTNQNIKKISDADFNGLAEEVNSLSWQNIL